MKRWMTFFLSVLCAAALTACGASGEKAQEKGFSNADIQAIVDAGAFSEELEELDADTAFLLYGLSDYGLTREDLTEAAVLRSTGATCEEGAVLTFSDGEKAGVAAEALGDYLESQIISNEDYRPNEIPKLKGAILKVKENTVLIVVPNDAAAVRSVYE